MEALGLGEIPYESQVVDEAALLSADSEEAFVREAFELHKELAQSVGVASAIRRIGDDGQPRPMTRNEAILAGLMVRCAKLQVGLLQFCVPDRIELLQIVSRSLTETAINLRYLIEHGDRDTYDAFVRSSLRIDKQLYDDIQANAADRDGRTVPIEDRMLRGINLSFQAAGMTLEEVDGNDRSSWTQGGIYGRFRALGRAESYLMFSVGSHYVHGNWHDLYAQHLRRIEGGFEIEMRFGAIRPQVLSAAVIVLADAALAYLGEIAAESEERDVLADRIGICIEKAQQIDGLHEAFLARN